MALVQDIIGESDVHKHALREARLIAPTSASVVLRGESGTGKELFARLIHQESRREGPFVPVNCAVLPESLVDSMLFGHRRGAFTGASEASPGLIASAHGGTLFLDEVAELPSMAQAKLLRVLQENTVLPVGETRERTIDVRIIAASHRDLREAVDAGRFREDLYFRLARVELSLPPLRERDQDVLLLARHQIAHEPALRELSLTRSAEAELLRHPWPGNVRELQNVLFRLTLHANGPITAEDVRAALGTTEGPKGDVGPQILACIGACGEGGSADLARATRLSPPTLRRALRVLVDAGELVVVGRGKATRYRLPASSSFDARSRAALAIAQRDGRVTRMVLAREHGLTVRTAGRVLAKLVEEGALIPDGQQGCAAGYVQPDPSERPGQPSPC